ncbi:MAG: acyltransferase [Campylobacterales bacterium]|nr:acyltransferase [Campylobacterales bacterium]
MKLNKIITFIKYLLAVPKSLYVNLRVLPFYQAIRLPIIVSNKTKLISLSGKVNLSKLKTGIFRIGFTGSEMIDYTYTRTMLQIDGAININGKVKIGRGSRLIVTGELNLGNNFITSGNATIICAKKISIGYDTMCAWESIIMDTDQHKIFDDNENWINQESEIKIGNNVWIGARSFILKNSVIEDGCIVGANTVLTKSFNQKDSIIVGNPPKIVKNNIIWKH